MQRTFLCAFAVLAGIFSGFSAYSEPPMWPATVSKSTPEGAALQTTLTMHITAATQAFFLRIEDQSTGLHLPEVRMLGVVAQGNDMPRITGSMSAGDRVRAEGWFDAIYLAGSHRVTVETTRLLGVGEGLKVDLLLSQPVRGRLVDKSALQVSIAQEIGLQLRDDQRLWLFQLTSGPDGILNPDGSVEVAPSFHIGFEILTD